MAANTLPKFLPMIGTAVGMIRPGQVLVVGTGIAGLQAVATAKRLGAVVHAADIRPDACEQGKSLGAKLVDLGIPAEIAVGKGGYARKLPDEWLLKEREILRDVAQNMDVLVPVSVDTGQAGAYPHYRRYRKIHATRIHHSGRGYRSRRKL